MKDHLQVLKIESYKDNFTKKKVVSIKLKSLREKLQINKRKYDEKELNAYIVEDKETSTITVKKTPSQNEEQNKDKRDQTRRTEGKGPERKLKEKGESITFGRNLQTLYEQISTISLSRVFRLKNVDNNCSSPSNTVDPDVTCLHRTVRSKDMYTRPSLGIR